jgi:hypothetical protein
LFTNNEIFTFSYYYLVKGYLEKKDYKIQDIYYPYTDSKFDIDDIIDYKGSFFIIHPDDDILFRNKNLDFINIEKTIDNKKNTVKIDDNGDIILNNKKPIIVKENYINKVEKIMNILREYYILDDKNNVTNIGKLIQDIIAEGFITKTESILCILDIIKNYENIDYHYIIFLIIYMEGLRVMLSKQIKNNFFDIRSDIINIIELFPKKLLLKEIFLYEKKKYTIY